MHWAVDSLRKKRLLLRASCVHIFFSRRKSRSKFLPFLTIIARGARVEQSYKRVCCKIILINDPFIRYVKCKSSDSLSKFEKYDPFIRYVKCKSSDSLSKFEKCQKF